jgi:hypothetical protein
MPTIQKPQLDRTSFPWQDQSDRFHRDLEAQRAQILGRSGFNREFGNSGDVPSTNAEREGAEFILELSGILSQAAAIKMDSGFKATNKVVATLKSIKKDPSLILKGGVEPEALAWWHRTIGAATRSRGRIGLTWTDLMTCHFRLRSGLAKQLQSPSTNCRPVAVNPTISCWIFSETNYQRVICALT